MNDILTESVGDILPRVIQSIIDRQRAFKLACEPVPGVRGSEIRTERKTDNHAS